MKKKLIVVVGPTASGKSDLTFKIAKDLNFEIIVCDAYQIYKEISKGINKPNENELKTIKHYFVNSISIYDDWNIKIFQSQINEILKDDSKNFILEGGSNLYIHCLIHNYNLNKLDFNLNYDDFSNEELFEKLKKLDEKESKKISINNRKRLIQSLRIIESNNEKKSVLDSQNNEPLYDFFLIRMCHDRKNLYEAINKRAEKMFNDGWKQEIEDLIKKDKNINQLNGFKAIGYQEIYQAILDNKEVDLNIIKQRTRNYAKRQETWINNKFKIDYNFYYYDQYNDLLSRIKTFLNEK